MTSTPGRLLHDSSARSRVLGSLACGLAVGLAASTATSWQFAALWGWMAGAGLLVVWMWTTMWPLSAAETRVHAARQDPGHAASDLVVLGAAIASLGGVAVLLTGPGASIPIAALTVASVAVAWTVVHTVFTARYARLYYNDSTGDYNDSAGGIDFPGDDGPPRYRDFAYVAFTVGMTFQVSDTDVTRQEFRDLVLMHMLLSYLLGAVVVAATINLIVSLPPG